MESFGESIRKTIAFLTDYEGMSFLDAMKTLIGEGKQEERRFPILPQQEHTDPKGLKLPEPAENNNAVYAYLKSRGIDARIIKECIDNGLLFQTNMFWVQNESGEYEKNACPPQVVFVGKDMDGTPRYACTRSCTGKAKHDAYGSDKAFAFALPDGDSKALWVFESAIDLLSHVTLILNYILKKGLWHQMPHLKREEKFLFSDINYSVASRDAKLAMFLQYCGLLNSLQVGATTKITINNRRLTRGLLERNLIPLFNDGRNALRDEYNGIILDSATTASEVVQEKYFTVSVIKNSYEEARTFFNRVSTEMESTFATMSSKLTPLDIEDRMRIFHDFYQIGQEESYHFNLQEIMRKGHSFCDSICPDSMTVKNDSIKIGKKYARVLYLREYPSYMKDSMIAELCDINRNLMLSIDIIPVPTDEAVKEGMPVCQKRCHLNYTV